MALKKVAEDKISSNPAVEKFVKDELEKLLKSTKMRELVERVSLQEEVSKAKAIRFILDRIEEEADELSKAERLIANLNLD